MIPRPIRPNATITAYQVRRGQEGRGGRAVMAEAFTEGFVPCEVSPVSVSREASLAAVGVRADLILRVSLDSLRCQPFTAPETGVERPSTGDRLAVELTDGTAAAWHTVTRVEHAPGNTDWTLYLQRASGEVLVPDAVIPGTETQR